jgi:hypothetical protein
MVPTFTKYRSTREMPSYTPAASPQVRRRLSPWPPRRPIHSGYGVARPQSMPGVHGRPTQIRQVRVGSTLTEFHPLVPLVHLLVLLAGPAPSGSTRAPRRCQDCSRLHRRLPGQAVLSFARLLRQPSGQGLPPRLGTLAPRGARTGHRTGGQDQPPPSGEAWPASPLPATTAPPGRPRGRCHSAARLAALQPPSLLETAAALPHVPGSPRLGVLRRLRPAPGRSADSGPSPYPALAAQDRADRDGSRVHCDSLDEGGAQLYPCGIATATPQHFTVASRQTSTCPPGSSPPVMKERVRAAPGPYPPDLSRQAFKRRNNAGSSRTPLRHARRARAI